MGNSNTSNLLGGSILDGLVSSTGSQDFQALAAGDKPVLIPLSKIHTWEEQPRSYFSQEAIDTLADSFRRQGFKGVLVVRPHPSIADDFQLIAGERRYRAAHLADIDKAYCFIGEFDDDAALDFALRENLNREDLSRLEETLGVLSLIETRYSINPEIVAEIVGREGHGDKLSARSNVTPSDSSKEDFSQELADITSILKEFDIELSSFRSNYLPTLKLQEPLKTAHLEKGLSYLKAESLNRIKDEQLLLELLAEVLDKNLSVRAVRDRVGQVLSTDMPASSSSQSTAAASLKDSANASKKRRKEKPGQCVLDLKEVVLTLSKADYRKVIEADPKKKRKIQAAVKNLKALLEQEQ